MRISPSPLDKLAPIYITPHLSFLSITLTVVEPSLKICIWPILHKYALRQIGVHYDLWGHGADCVHQFTGDLVLPPVSVWQVVVAVAGVKVEALVLCRGIMHAMTGRQGTKYFNLQKTTTTKDNFTEFT